MRTLKNLFLLLFTISVFTCCDKDNDNVIPENKDIILSDNNSNVFLKRKGHWGSYDNRLYQYTYSSDSQKSSSLVGMSLHINFMKELKNLNLYINNNAQVIYEDTFSTRKNSSYSIPLTFIQGEIYELEITTGKEAYYLIFSIQ